MNKKVLKTLEYDKVIEKLTGYASSDMGRALCEKLEPSSDIDEIRRMQAETSDAIKRVRMKGSISFGSFKDVSDSLKRLEIGGSLGITELLRISSLLNAAAKAKAYGRHEVSETEDDSLDERFRLLEPLTSLNNEISRCILSEDEISDDASSGLHHVRRQIKNINDKIHSQLTSIMNSWRDYIQDTVITMRDGRYCIPVRSDYKSQVNGMVLDQSSTGSTLFIEPMQIIQLDAQLHELELQEKKEIDAVLATLSSLAASHTAEIATDQEVLAQLDFIFAKGSLSRHYKCSEPVLNNKGVINIKDARHPLLDQESVVPINVELGRDFDLLIVTGPNTGGKTVSLKTVGLITLMGQAGLQIPAFEGSELAVFDEVFADIGDEQSIEQSLSTFSAHMTNIVSILERADARSLCLFDELGAGTDPAEGAALAVSILNFLHNMQCRTMATTHYSELKVFALTTPGVENASCEFNVEDLKPTYRLLIGIPGKSNAFAISKRLGLPDHLIEDAASRLETNDKAFEDLLSDLETSRKTIEKEQEEIKAYKEEEEALKARIAQKEERLDSQRDNRIRQANEEAQRILKEAKETADEAIKNINRLGASAQVRGELEAERTKLRNELNKVDDKLAVKTKGPKKTISPKSLRIGDSVKVLSLNMTGTVSSLPNSKGDLYVQMGILRSQVNIKDLERVEDDAEDSSDNIKESTGSGKIRMSKSMAVSPELNLIGMTTDEAIPVLEKYLDDAYLAHLDQVRIIHGRGTGALKNAVHAKLKKLKYIRDFRLGEFGEGDAGVTIVDFK